MGENSGIAWTTHTANPWIGCEKVSEACKHCYAEINTFVRNHRSKGLELWGHEAARVETKAAWTDPHRWNAAARSNREMRAQGFALPNGRKHERPRVFCASLADIFEDRRDLDEKRARYFAEVIERCTELDWLLLTKRPQRVLDLVPATWRDRWPSHVWIGTTAETQARADERIPHLLKIPAPVRFVSVEPQIEHVSLERWLCREAWWCSACKAGVELGEAAWHGFDPSSEAYCPECDRELDAACGPSISWVICGGESGVHARPFDLTWARALRDECAAANVAFFMKQLGAKPFNAAIRDRASADPSEWPEDLRVQKFPAGLR